MVTVTGWGTLNEGGLGLPNVLHKVTFWKRKLWPSLQHFFVKVDVPVVSDEDCRASYEAGG